MSMMAGIWHFDNKPVEKPLLQRWEETLVQHGPDRWGEYRELGLAMFHRALWLTQEDEQEYQPVFNRTGCILTWDGRLDNRGELLRDLDSDLRHDAGDAELALAAWKQWGADGFRRLNGDWALAIWDSRRHRIILSRDYIGARPLYYSWQPDRLLWCSHLDTLVLHGELDLTLSDDFVATYLLSPIPNPELTPYRSIKAVPPGGWVEVTAHKLSLHNYDAFHGFQPLRYKTDGDYEEHFRCVFRQAVKRRMRTAYPILADLSGGLDSSSVVCMAYDILKRGEASAEINTLSYYTLEELNGDERPYAEAVERYIGKKGTHIEVRSQGQPLEPLPQPYFCFWPGHFASTLDRQLELHRRIGAQGNRVHLTGLGGDETTGGVPNPSPQLALRLSNFEFADFIREACQWSLAQKRTVWQTSAAAIAALLPEWLRATTKLAATKDPWVRPDVRRRYIHSLAQPVLGAWRPLFSGITPPSLIGHRLGSILTGPPPLFVGSRIRSCPYLDRDFVWFVEATPPDQLLQAGKRRHLMRRALAGIVPEEVLWRKTKWLGIRQPATQLMATLGQMGVAAEHLAFSRYIDLGKFREQEAVLSQDEMPRVVPLTRAIGLAHLLTQLSCHREISRAANSEAKKSLFEVETI